MQCYLEVVDTHVSTRLPRSYLFLLRRHTLSSRCDALFQFTPNVLLQTIFHSALSAILSLMLSLPVI